MMVERAEYSAVVLPKSLPVSHKYGSNYQHYVHTHIAESRSKCFENVVKHQSIKLMWGELNPGHTQVHARKGYI